MSSRDDILERLRLAQGDGAAPDLPPPPADRSTFGDYPGDGDYATLKGAFRTHLETLKGEFHEVPTVAAAAELLGELLKDLPGAGVFVQDAPLTTAVLAQAPAWRTVCHHGAGCDQLSPAMAELGAAVTVADALVARTGSVVARTLTTGGRRATVLPPLHIVLATPDQMLPSLDAVMAHWWEVRGEPWSYATLITGPSRTADIEKVLVLGAHGPKRLVVIVVGE